MADTSTTVREALLPRREAERITGLGRSAIAERRNPNSKHYDPTFPAPIKLAGSNSVRYVESELLAWVHTKIQTARTKPSTRISVGGNRPGARREGILLSKDT